MDGSVLALAAGAGLTAAASRHPYRLPSPGLVLAPLAASAGTGPGVVTCAHLQGS